MASPLCTLQAISFFQRNSKNQLQGWIYKAKFKKFKVLLVIENQIQTQKYCQYQQQLRSIYIERPKQVNTMSKGSFRKIKQLGQQLAKSAKNYVQYNKKQTAQNPSNQSQNKKNSQSTYNQRAWNQYSKKVQNIINMSKASANKSINQLINQTQSMKKKGSQLSKEKYEQINIKLQQKIKHSKESLREKSQNKFSNLLKYVGKQSKDDRLPDQQQKQNKQRQSASYFSQLKDRYTKNSQRTGIKQEVSIKGISQRLLKKAQKMGYKAQKDENKQQKRVDQQQKDRMKQSSQQSNKKRQSLIDIIHQKTAKIKPSASLFLSSSLAKGSQAFKSSETIISEKAKSLFLKYRMKIFIWFVLGMFIYGIASQIPRQLRLYIRDQTFLTRSKKDKAKDYDEQEQSNQSRHFNTKQQLQVLKKQLKQLKRKVKENGQTQKKQQKKAKSSE